jgi:hypothetical protein
LYLHIGAGSVALVSGAVSGVAKKGARLHRRSGMVFVVSMLIMATIGAAVSPFLKPAQWVNVIAGTFTLYLVISAWLTVRHRNPAGLVGIAMLVASVSIALAAFAIAMGMIPAEKSDSGAAMMFAFVVTLAAVGDLRMVIRRALTATQRLFRHLWRMCYALAIAIASLFLGQPQLFPEQVRGTGLLFIPVVAVLGLMVFWMIRVRFVKNRRLELAPGTSPV